MTKADYQRALADLQLRSKQIIRDLQSGKLQQHEAAEKIVSLNMEKAELIESMRRSASVAH
jgi:hypothetical protein